MRLNAHMHPRAGLTVRELPVGMLPRAEGKSFITPLVSAFYIFKTLVVLLVGQLRPRTNEPDGHP